jgi:hypothetical protein
MVQQVSVIRPDHGEAEQVVDDVLLAPDQLQSLATEPLNTKNGAKEDCVLGD